MSDGQQTGRQQAGLQPTQGESGLGKSGSAESRGGVDVASRTIFNDTGIRRALTRIAHEILERNEEPEDLYLVAIPNGGIPLARQLAANLKEIAGIEVEVGVLDTTLYRDDLVTLFERPALRETVMPAEVDERVVVLVDDVVKSGRTIRAAMDALMDFGRPRAVQVVGLVDRGHRELPIKIDFVGKNLPTSPGEHVHLLGGQEPDGPLQIVVLSEDRAAPAAEPNGGEA